MQKSLLIFYCCVLYLGLHSQTKSVKDSTKFFDYYLILNCPTSRNYYPLSVGIERIKPLGKSTKWNYSSLISISGGNASSHFTKATYYNPKHLSVCFQPFHLLYGKSLQFETGISTSIELYRYNGKPYLKDNDSTIAASYRDVVRLFYMAGLRYTFKKPQVSIKFIIGVQHTFFLHDVPYRRNSPPIIGELGVNWRLRKKIAR